MMRQSTEYQVDVNRATRPTVLKLLHLFTSVIAKK